MKLRFKRPPLGAILRRAALGYLIIWVLSPPLAYGTVWRVLAVMAVGTWLVLELLTPRSVLLRPPLVVLAVAAFVAYSASIEWLFPDSADISRQFQVWIMFFFLIVGESLSRGREGDARFCFWLVLIVLPIWSFVTLRSIDLISVDVARTISRSSAEARMLSEQGVGGYGFVYTVLLCLPFVGYFALKPGFKLGLAGDGRWQRGLARGIVLLNFVLGSALIVRAGYSIALLLAGLVIAFLLLVRSRRALPLAISLTLSVLLVLLAAISIEPALRNLEHAAAGTEYESKVRDVRLSLADESARGTVEGRSERYLRSYRLFTENPVLGTLSFDDVGKHSAILDRFAQYGFAIGLLFLFLLVYLPLRLLRDHRVPIGLALAFLTVALFFPLMNNVFMSWGLVLYVFSRGAMVATGVPIAKQVRLGNLRLMRRSHA